MIDHIQNTQDHFLATIIADSISSETSERVTTFQLRLPRSIHSELLTHRVFSRNASSSRAIPIKTLMAQVHDTPFIPLSLGKNGKGMQAKEDLDAAAAELVRRVIYEGRQQALDLVQRLSDLGVHKQVANRYTEPWQWISVLVTSTDYENWFALREHPDAEPHIQHLAGLMLQAYNASIPVVKYPGAWHLPYIDDSVPANLPDLCALGKVHDMELNGSWFAEAFTPVANQLFLRLDGCLTVPISDLLRAAISAGRSARTSYKTFSGTSDIAEDLRLFMSLASGMPMHASPLEHQVLFCAGALSAPLGGNLSREGKLVQFRKLFKCERSKDARVIRYKVNAEGKAVVVTP